MKPVSENSTDVRKTIVTVIVIVLPIRGLRRASSEGGEEGHDDD